MIAIIDYGMGNLRSVEKALEAVGAVGVKVTSEINDIDKAKKIVMPGVGAMGEAVKELERRNLIPAIKKNIFKKPYLGICLGLQLLFGQSEEGENTRGLNILEGKVVRFKNDMKIPHMGWNVIRMREQSPKSRVGAFNFLQGIPDNSYFYFCHSYFVEPFDKSIISTTTDYGQEFVSSICKDNLFAMQFHPEKSQELGLRIIENFVKM